MRPSAAFLATARPARTEPVMETMAGVRWLVMSAPVPPSPSTTFSTPAGRISPARRASTSVDSGVVSLGLSTIVLPAARAGPIFHRPMSRG